MKTRKVIQAIIDKAVDYYLGLSFGIAITTANIIVDKLGGTNIFELLFQAQGNIDFWSDIIWYINAFFFLLGWWFKRMRQIGRTFWGFC